MALEKIVVVDRIEVLENGSVQIRTKTSIMENGSQISGTYHRHIVAPGDDYSNEDARVKAICSAVHSADVVNAYKLAQSYNDNVII